MKRRLKSSLSRRKKRKITGEDTRPSAVLMPVFCYQGRYHLLFTERTDEVDFHKGQVCFPGGTQEPSDSSSLQTALREAEEEISLKPGDVDILGELDDIRTLTSNYVISPFVAFIPYPYPFKADGREIREIFSVPLSFLMDEVNFRQDSYAYKYQGHTIWGATARMVREFLDLLKSESGAR